MTLLFTAKELASVPASSDANGDGSTKSGRGSEGGRGGRKKYKLTFCECLIDLILLAEWTDHLLFCTNSTSDGLPNPFFFLPI